MNVEYPGITGKELLKKLQELSPEDLEKRIVIGVMDLGGSNCILGNFSNGVQMEPGTYCWGSWKVETDGKLTFEKHCEPCIKILSIIN